MDWRIVMGLAFAAFAVIGLLSLGEGLSLMHTTDVQRGWPTAQGVVTASYVEDEPASDGTYYSPVVVYEYDAGGAHRQSSRISYVAQSSTERSWALEVAGRYPVGANVTVHYDPGDPGYALLEPGTGGAEWLPLLVGVAFTSVGVLGSVGTMLSKGRWG